MSVGSSRRWIGGFAFFAVVGCGDLPHSNPVDPDAPTVITIAGPSEIHSLNEAARYTATFTPAGRAQFITWATSNPAVLAFVAEGAFVTHGVGKATITATLGTHSATYDVTVRQVPASHSFAVCAPDSTVFTAFHEPKALCAVALDSLGSALALRPVFTSSDSTTVTLKDSVATSLRDGSVTVHVQWLGAQDSIRLRVHQVAKFVLVSSVGGSQSLPGGGGTLQLQDSAIDWLGYHVVGHLTTWQSNRPGVMDVSSTGLVRATAWGTAVISATVDSAIGGIGLQTTGGGPPTIDSAYLSVAANTYNAPMIIIEASVSDPQRDASAIQAQITGVGSDGTLQNLAYADTLIPGISPQHYVGGIFGTYGTTRATATEQASDISQNGSAPVIVSGTSADTVGGPVLTQATMAPFSPDSAVLRVVGSDANLDLKEAIILVGFTPTNIWPGILVALPAQSGPNFDITLRIRVSIPFTSFVVLRDSRRRLSQVRQSNF
ncbi:MAG TPA: hypothetical protein VEI06_05840 [Gemmatimonadaceae bacterium]|nr:hypothetical protein [Gemmatimonadaceae bacterium]